MIVALASAKPNNVLDSYLAGHENPVSVLRNQEHLRAIVRLDQRERQGARKNEGEDETEDDCPGYKLGRELGRGSFSVVYQGKHDPAMQPTS